MQAKKFGFYYVEYKYFWKWKLCLSVLNCCKVNKEVVFRMDMFFPELNGVSQRMINTYPPNPARSSWYMSTQNNTHFSLGLGLRVGLGAWLCWTTLRNHFLLSLASRPLHIVVWSWLFPRLIDAITFIPVFSSFLIHFVIFWKEILSCNFISLS